MEISTWKDWRVFSFWMREQQPNESLPWYLIPWKNRFSRFIFMLASISTCTAIVYAWQPFSSMLFAEGVYSWRCTPEEIASHQELLQSSPESAYQPICDNQDNSIQALYIINLSTEFSLGMVAGVVLDYLGPFLTGLVGQILLLCGVLCIALASATRNYLYIPSMIFLGGGCNFLTFSAISMADYFPSHQALIASLVIGCQNGSTIITSLLDIIYRQYPSVTLQTLFLSYMLCILVPLGICFILAAPLVRPALNPQIALVVDATPHTDETPTTSDPQDRQSVVQSEPKDESQSQAVVYSRSSKQDLLTVELCLIGLFNSVATIQFNYYPTILRDISGDRVARLNGWLLPSQGVLGVFYGIIIDAIGTLPVCHALMVMIAVVYTFCLIPSYGLQYATTIIFIIAATQIYTVKFTFVQETFSPNNHGVLLGILSLLGGLTLLVNIPIHNLSDTRPVIIGMLVSAGACVIITVILQIRKRKGINHFGVKTAVVSGGADVAQSTTNSTKQNESGIQLV